MSVTIVAQKKTDNCGCITSSKNGGSVVTANQDALLSINRQVARGGLWPSYRSLQKLVWRCEAFATEARAYHRNTEIFSSERMVGNSIVMRALIDRTRHWRTLFER
jgi:hypothetical protein